MLIYTGEKVSEELVDDVRELVAADVRLQADLPASRDTVHVDLHTQALVTC